MMDVIGVGELERFRGAIRARLGIHFDEGKFTFLADVLGGRLEATGQEALAIYRASRRARTRKSSGHLRATSSSLKRISSGTSNSFVR